MNRVLVTGLGIANNLGMCESCNLDFVWLAKNPSVLLWADKIILPTTGYEATAMHNEEKHEKVINLFLEVADKANLLSKVDFSGVYLDSVVEGIQKSAILCEERLINTFPDKISKGDKGVPGEIIIENEGFCLPYVESVLASLKVASDYDANCLFSEHEHKLLKYIYNSDTASSSGAVQNSVYNEVFSLYMPEAMKIHEYAFTNPHACSKCKNETDCQNTYLNETEKALQNIFKWREYDEIQQAKEEINKILRTKNEIKTKEDLEDVVKSFQGRQEIVNKNINKRFPKIERWTKMTTVIGACLTAVSKASDNTPLTIAGAATTVAAVAAKELLEVYKSKNNWAGFINEMKTAK